MSTNDNASPNALELALAREALMYYEDKNNIYYWRNDVPVLAAEVRRLQADLAQVPELKAELEREKQLRLAAEANESRAHRAALLCIKDNQDHQAALKSAADALEKAYEQFEEMDGIHGKIMESGPSCTCGTDPEGWCVRCNRSIKLSNIADKGVQFIDVALAQIRALLPKEEES